MVNAGSGSEFREKAGSRSALKPVRIRNTGVNNTSVAYPEPDPEGSETFGRIRSGTDINVLDPD